MKNKNKEIQDGTPPKYPVSAKSNQTFFITVTLKLFLKLRNKLNVK